MAPIWRKFAFFVSLVLIALAVPSPAWAKGSVKLATNRAEEDARAWKLKITIDYGSTPTLEYVPMIFSFKPVVMYERSITDASPQKPIENRVPLAGQTSLNLPMDVGFGDPATGKRFNTTKFSVRLTRDVEFEAGEYELTVKLVNGGTIGGVQRVVLTGENKIIDRRSLMFGVQSATVKKAASPAAAAEPQEKKGGAAEDQGPDLSGIGDAPTDKLAEAPAPPPVPPKSGGCAVHLSARSVHDRSASGLTGIATKVAVLLALGGMLLARRRRSPSTRALAAGITPHRRRKGLLAVFAATVALVAGCARTTWQPPPCPTCGSRTELPRPAQPIVQVLGEAAPTADEASRFVAKTEVELLRLAVKNERANWVSSNFITSDTQEIAAEADEELMAFMARSVKGAARFDGVSLAPGLRRKLTLLKNASTLPAPADATKTTELAKLSGTLKEAYGTGKYCPTKAGALRAELAKTKDHADA
ncbi:MAG: hypothetical protein EXR75_16885, partial [Myxococcales bacterium]|nr:hypothetical protein [Myxococcales bacterium]